MELPRIAAAATATPTQRFTQAELLAMAGYRDERRRGFFEASDIGGRHLYIDRERFRPDESVDELNDRFRRGALELGEAALRSAARSRGLAPAGRRLPGHHHVHGPDDAEPRRPPGGAPRLPPRRAARARRRHRLRRRGGRAAAGMQSHPGVPRSPRARARRRDLLGRLLPRRPAGERGGPRHLRRRRGGARAEWRRRAVPRSWSIAPCSAPSTSTRWASSTREAGRAWCCPRTCGASAPA